MIDINLMEKEFKERRKKYNIELLLNQSGKITNKYLDGHEYVCDCKPFRLDEKPLNEDPDLLIVKYLDGKGVILIDQEELFKLPKMIQNKIFSLHKL